MPGGPNEDTSWTVRGKVVLTADESVAYPDPTIKTIWGGRLEFPLMKGPMNRGRRDNPGAPQRAGKMKRRLRRALWLAAFIAAAAGAFFAWDRLVRPWVARREVDRLIARFQADGDAESLDRLMERLTTGSVSEEEGNRILSAVFQPKIVMCSAYRSDRGVTISVETALDSWFHDGGWCGMWLCWTLAEDVPDELREYLGTYRLNPETTELDPEPPVSFCKDWPPAGPRRERCWVEGPEKGGPNYGVWPPGEHTAKTVVSYAMTATPTKKALRWPSSRPFPASLILERKTVVLRESLRTYRCTKTIPITFRVLAPEEAEKVVLRSDPALDQAMKAAFTQCPVKRSRGSSRENRAVGSLALSWKELPENVAFLVRFQADGGIELQPDWDYPDLLEMAGSGWEKEWTFVLRPQFTLGARTRRRKVGGPGLVPWLRCLQPRWDVAANGAATAPGTGPSSRGWAFFLDILRTHCMLA